MENDVIYKTTEGGLVLMNGENIMGTFDEFGKPSDFTEFKLTQKLRNDSAVAKKILEGREVEKKKENSRTLIDKIKGHDVFLDNDTFKTFIDLNGKLVPLDGAGVKKITKEMAKVEKLKISATASSGGYKMGDRVLMYGPTGTGKTYNFLDTVEAMKAAGQLDYYDVVTITEGFEDIDFLCNIVTTEKGIEYREKAVIKLLEEAAKGKKVAILLDELNRGGKSFLNLILKLLDPVDGKNYVVDNFVKDKKIIIPQENIFFFAAVNLGGKYVGTNTLDEALLDRFNIVSYKGYDLSVENDMMKVFGSLSSTAKEIVKYVREMNKDGEIRAPISTRGVKMWAEAFLNSGKTNDDFFRSFEQVLLNRLVSVDDFGNPNPEEISLVMKKFVDGGFIK